MKHHRHSISSLSTTTLSYCALVNNNPPKPTESLDEILRVERLVAGGLGFGRRSSGEPVFVRGAVPGDLVYVDTVQKYPGYSRAHTYHLTQASPNRRTSPCEYQGSCGGCDLMPLTEPAQRSAKHVMVLDILQRTAKLDATEGTSVPLVWRDVDLSATLGYRSRVRLHISGRGQFGFRAEKSHDLVEVPRCLVANQTVNAVLGELKRCATLHPGLFAAFGQVEIRALGERPDLLWFPHPEPKAQSLVKRGAHRGTTNGTRTKNHPSSLDALENLRRSLENLSGQAPHWLMSSAALPDAWRQNAQVAALTALPNATPTELLFAPAMFTQVNWSVNQAIIQDVLTRVERKQFRSFLDLYCGAGNFSLPLLGQGLDGIGIESNSRSIEAAKVASEHQRLGGRFFSGDVTKALAHLVKRSEAFDIVLLDPPRAGFRDAAPHVPHLAKKAVFICSCDPTTFARDLRTLLDLGFSLAALSAYDMFPQTHHVELTAWLDRNSAL
jgi:23S rRNA (uracil1939-C5)-methyltransferase